MLNKFKMKTKTKPIFEKDLGGEKILKSTLKRIACYRCGNSGSTFMKDSIGYYHTDLNVCTQNIKTKIMRKKFLREYIRIQKRLRRIDIRILNRLLEIWQRIWGFLEKLNGEAKGMGLSGKKV